MDGHKLLSRQAWLKANGFVLDPFLPEAFHAETDQLLISGGLLSYVDRKDNDLLTGVINDYANADLDNRGYHFIFSQPGGGKSSLRKRIHSLYDVSELLGEIPQILIIDYVDHSYSTDEAEIYHHVQRIIALAEKKLEVDFSEEKAIGRKSPIQALKKLVKTCRKYGTLRIFLLVDDVDVQSFKKIESLAGTRELFGISGLIVKFLFPESLFLLAQLALPFDDFPPYFITWGKNELSQVLNQRLIACLHPDYGKFSGVPLISFLVDGYLAATVEERLTKIGELSNSPRLMWQLGNYLLDEHIGRTSMKKKVDLINHEVFAQARLKLFDDIIASDMAIGYKLYGETDKKSRRIHRLPNSARQKANVFISYAEEDESLLNDSRLYEELLLKNFKPWMRREIFPGEDPEIAIKSAINKSDFFLLCLSSKSNRERGFFQKEIRLAKDIQDGMNDNDIFMIPVRLMRCNLPDGLKLWPVDWFMESQREQLFAAFEEGRIRRRHKK
jgi:hypothetical protein